MNPKTSEGEVKQAVDTEESKLITSPALFKILLFGIDMAYNTEADKATGRWITRWPDGHFHRSGLIN